MRILLVVLSVMFLSCSDDTKPVVKVEASAPKTEAAVPVLEAAVVKIEAAVVKSDAK